MGLIMPLGRMTNPILLLTLVLLPFCANAKDKAKHKMALKDSLAAYWNFEQNPALGFEIWDQTHNGNHLRPQSLAASQPTLVPGKIDNGTQIINGAQLKLQSNSGISHQGNSFTVCGWFQPQLLTTPLPILGDTEGEWLVQMEVSGADHYLRFRIEPDGRDATINITDVPLIIGQWYFIAFGWYDHSGSFAWASVNLSDKVRTELSAPLVTTLNPPLFQGESVFDEIGIWRRALTAQEIREIYNDGDGFPFEEWDVVTPCREITCCD